MSTCLQCETVAWCQETYIVGLYFTTVVVWGCAAAATTADSDAADVVAVGKGIGE